MEKISQIEEKRQERAALEKELARLRTPSVGDQVDAISGAKIYEDYQAKEQALEKVLFEGRILENRLKILDGEIETLTNQEAFQKVQDLARQATLNREEDAKAQEEKIRRDTEYDAIRAEADRIIPRKWLQISSSRWVKMQKEVHDRRIVGLPLRPSFFGDPPPKLEFEEFTRIERIEIQAIPARVRELQDEGWKITEGQAPIEPEVLGYENARKVPVFQIPEILI